MKILVLVEAQKVERLLSTFSWLSFILLWPGMRPSLFATSRRRQNGVTRFLLIGTANIAAGVGLCLVARWIWLRDSIESAQHAESILLVCSFMVGISLLLHFGLFQIATGMWRLFGINAGALFRKPLSSRSLSEFWSRRWNNAYSEMMSQVVYRPVNFLTGHTAAMWAVFLFSGFLHEIAISLPVRSGYGLPTLYFLAQAGLIKLEDYISPKGMWARVYATAAVILPIPLLFHPAFIHGVVIPLLA
jgi:alginate O-acetyltransferase complex protein AlgI